MTTSTKTTTAEFWADERWPKCVIPRGSWVQRVLCRLLGHQWDTHYWSGQGQPDWPQHDYCLGCWRFREKPGRTPAASETRQTVVTMSARTRQ